MDKVVVSIGGSVLVPDNNDGLYIKSLAEMLKSVADKVEVTVVCGGGKVSRYYSKIGRELGATTEQIDLMGIATTRINAQLLNVALKDLSTGKVPVNVNDCAKEIGKGKIAVMGGTEPGHTTDAVSAAVAERIGAVRIVNASNIDAVYTDDPRKNPNAKKIEKMTIRELKDIVYDNHEACKSSVFDPAGVDIAMKSKIDILMVDGRNLDELKNAILGKKINGTFVDSH